MFWVIRCLLSVLFLVRYILYLVDDEWMNEVVFFWFVGLMCWVYLECVIFMDMGIRCREEVGVKLVFSIE